MNAISAINTLPSNREEIKTFVARVVSELEDGQYDALEVRRNIKAIEDALEAIKKQAKDIFISEAERHGKEFQYKNAEFKVAEFGIKYNYEGTGDPVWAYHKAALKKREEYLRSLKESDYWTDEETGECYKINPPLKTSTTSVSVNLL